MKTTKNRSKLLLLGGACWASLASSSSAWAYENIIEPFQSVRASAMGGTLLTNGLYEDNFFGNPARHSQNGTWRFTLFSVMAEVNPNVTSVMDVVSGFSLDKLSSVTGKNIHGRAQVTLFSFVLPNIGGGRWSFGMNTTVSALTDVGLRQAYQLQPGAYADAGVHFGLSRAFLSDESLHVGTNLHARGRGTSNSGFGLIDILKGKSLSPSNFLGFGYNIDFDLGATYDLPVQWKEVEFQVSAVMNNVLGGKFSPILDDYANVSNMSRIFGFGISAWRPALGPFLEPTLSIEFRNLGYGGGGSFFRHLHFGGELDWSVFSPRVGFNQGYISAGLGIDLRVVKLDLSTYGEEMGLNAGTLQDRRYAVKLELGI